MSTSELCMYRCTVPSYIYEYVSCLGRRRQNSSTNRSVSFVVNRCDSYLDDNEKFQVAYPLTLFPCAPQPHPQSSHTVVLPHTIAYCIGPIRSARRALPSSHIMCIELVTRVNRAASRLECRCELLDRVSVRASVVVVVACR